MKTFRSLLDEVRQDQKGVKERVNIAEAGSQYYDQHIDNVKQEETVDGLSGQPIPTGGLNQSYIKKNEISSAAVAITDTFRSDVEALDSANYTDFISFVRKYQTLINELPKNRTFKNPSDKTFIATSIKDPLAQISGIKGPLLRAAFAFEDFKKQFKPLKLADRLLGEVPIIGEMIRQKISDIEAGEDLLARQGAQAARQRTREKRRQNQVSDTVAPAGGAMNLTDDLTQERLQDENEKMMTRTTGTGGKTEEQRKEAGLEREETQNIFEAIMMNTKETNDILKGIGGDLEGAGAPGGGGVGFLEALLGGKIIKDMFKGKGKGSGVKTGFKVAAAGGGLAAVMKYFKGGGAAAAAAKASSVQAKAKGVKTKNTNFAKKAIGLGKSAAKPLAGFIAVYDLITGFANSDEIMGLDEGTLGVFESSLVGISKAIDTFTFGILDTKKTANFLIDLFTDTAADLDPLREERAVAMAEFEKQKKRKDAGMSTVGYAFLENKVKDLDQRIVALGGVSLADMMSSDPSDTTLRKGFDLATMGSIKDDPEFARLVAEILKQNKDLLAVQQNNIQNNTQTIFPDSPSANADMSIPYHITGRYE